MGFVNHQMLDKVTTQRQPFDMRGRHQPDSDAT